MTCWGPKTRTAVPRTLGVRLEILKAMRALAGQDEDEKLARRRGEIAALRRDLEQLAQSFRDACREANPWLRSYVLKYSPDEPRVPPGNPDGGQWTSVGRSGSSNDLPDWSDEKADTIPGNGYLSPIPANDARVISDATPDNTWKPGAQYAQISVQNNAKSNNPAIDRTTETLLQTLARVHALLGDGSGPWYGSRIHLAFASDVRAQNLSGIGRSGVEQSFSLGDIADYGEDGTIKVDVYMRDDLGNIIAIWDVKTGGAVLSGGRVRRLRAEAGVGADVPIIELHVTRGATLKARTLGSVVHIVATIRQG